MKVLCEELYGIFYIFKTQHTFVGHLIKYTYFFQSFFICGVYYFEG